MSTIQKDSPVFATTLDGNTVTTPGGTQTKPIENVTPPVDKTIKDTTTTDSPVLKNTGSGAAAAEGTAYSWDTKSKDMAQNQYQQDVLASKQEMLANRQTIEANAQNYQQQADMMQYTNNQSAEKVGWTGGYVLDQNRQMEYLKSSIQAQMYGAMELQKYGYDSALAAARLSYDLNQQQFAQQYYEQAVSQALSEAQLTGVYFSAETKDMMAQRSVADQKLNDYITRDETGNIVSIDREKIEQQGTEEVKQALKIRDQITNWFKANDVSEAGVQTLEAWQTEQSLALQEQQQWWTQYQALLARADNLMSQNATLFFQYDSEGNIATNADNTMVTTIDLSKLDAAGLVAYATNKNPQAKESLYSFLNYKVEEAIVGYKNTIAKQSGDKTNYELTMSDIKEYIKKELKPFIDEINTVDKDILNEWEYNTSIIGNNGSATLSINSTSYDLISNTLTDRSKGSEGSESSEGSGLPSLDPWSSTANFISYLKPMENSKYESIGNIIKKIEEADSKYVMAAKDITDYEKFFGDFTGMGKESSEQYKYVKAIVDAASQGKASGVLIETNYGGESLFHMGNGDYDEGWIIVINGTIIRLTDNQADRLQELYGFPDLDASGSKDKWAKYGVDKTWD